MPKEKSREKRKTPVHWVRLIAALAQLARVIFWVIRWMSE